MATCAQGQGGLIVALYLARYDEVVRLRNQLSMGLVRGQVHSRRRQ